MGINTLVFLRCQGQDAGGGSAEIDKIVSVTSDVMDFCGMTYNAQRLSQNLASLPGVMEVLVDEGHLTIYLKVNSLFDEKQLDGALKESRT